MAVYEDKDITVGLINDKFPKVASAIIAQANTEVPTFTAESFKEKYPEIAASYVAQGKEEGITEGVNAENERVKAIEAVSVAGYEDVVAAAKADGKSTAQDVKLAIFDKMQASTTSTKSAITTDGKNLAAQVAALNTEASPDVDSKDAEAKAAADMMAKAGKKARGEK